ncbi:DUF4857 domain-containing protein [Prolixibacteraceae bacterium Z1-6]|uniref:DUF4857 domain-containing protein n=1 Tax=Draconibacterium aestuarii TaxID=2998507 RepID=A0A9X3J581_9BACT|nr:DUF4857 domain-containing protein [Prolixibacteraceae bacterium Z1-6]
MVKLSRYFLVIIAIIGFGIALPKLYWVAFAQPIRAPFIQYSCIDHDFMLLRSGDEVTRTNSKGDTFTREEYENKLPLMYTRQLLMNNTMPDSIDGVEMDMHDISNNRSTFRVRPKEIHAPLPTLFPLFESQSGRANLEMPKDFFRITWRMEFIDAESNKVDEEKSRMFSAVLYKRGFKFPAKSINGLPTTRKSCDEGYLVIDSADQLFHIKLVKGLPFVEKAELPEGLKFRSINCVDFKDKFYYAYLFSTDNHVYVLTQYDYQLVKLDVENINPEENEIRIYGDLFNYNVISTGEGEITSQVLDKDYNKVNEYNEIWPVRDERKEGKVAQLLFPAQLKMTNSNSSYVRFFFEANKSFNWIFLSLLLMATQFMIIRKRKENIKNQLVDLGIIAVTGIFGFIAVNFFPNKFFK